MSKRSITLEQCLFGYEDGHRMLASSIPLGAETAALTELSDLAPGAVFGGSKGYWTGVPAPGIGRYALMRTWPAPEMSRPGCVWTHALLFEPGLLEEVYDLSALRTLFARPQNVANLASYRERLSTPVLFDLDPRGGARENLELVSALLNSLYGSTDGQVRVDQPGDLDDSLFAVWSQQWPRLRRNFRFQTAATRESRSAGGARFDVTAILQSSGVVPVMARGSDGPWLRAAVSDVLAQSDRDLRRFLWRYGSDVKRQRGSFRPLVQVNLLHETPTPDAGFQILKLITASFPDVEDAVRLKQELVDGELVPAAQLDLLKFVLTQGGDVVFPPPTKEGVARLALLWPERPDELLYLAERSADAQDPVSRSIFDTVTGAVPTEAFWLLTDRYPRVREQMVQARPDLLVADGALELDNSTMIRMLRLVPAGAPVLATLLPSLLTRDDGLLAAEAFELFQGETALRVVSTANSGSGKIGRAWLRELTNRPNLLLDPAVMGLVRRTSLLYEFADALGWLAPEVVSAGSDPWIAALVDITSDLSDDGRDTLRCFLVALAIASGGDGGRRLLEKFFDAVHDQELRSRLPRRARDILLPVLADAGWGKNWDYGLRLRLAVAAAYVRNGYPLESYARLSGSRQVRAMLADAAGKVYGGAAYAMNRAGFAGGSNS